MRAFVAFGRGLALSWAMLLLVLSPAHAFEIFGYKFFETEDEAQLAGTVDPVRYTTAIALETDDAALLETLTQASALINQQDLPPSGLVGLLQRVKDDRANLVAKLYENSRYGGVVNISINGRPYEQIGVTEELASGAPPVSVTISVEAGPEFTFGAIMIDGGSGPQQVMAMEDSGLQTGRIASSTVIVVAENAVVTAWQKQGYPYAKATGRKVVADHTFRTLDVTLSADPGPQVTIDGVQVSGNERVDGDFIIRQADLPQGVLYHPDILARAQKNLRKLEALASVTVHMADSADARGHAPVIIEVSERKRRTIGAGALYSSTEGAGGEIFWLHRNVFGHAETFRAEAEIGQLLMADTIDEYNGRFSVLYGEPGFLDPYTRLDLKATVLQEEPDPYHRRGVVAEALLTHDYSEYVSFSGGITYDWSRIDDAFGRNNYSLLTLPLTAQYDSRNDLLDATSGLFGRLTVEPQYEIESSSPYVETDAEFRYYFALDADERYVIAGRGLAGTIWGAEIDNIPAHRRLYAGGGGSVRGYEYLNIGPRRAGFGPIGGLARVEGSLEARIKITDTIGIVPFIDAGFVTETSGFGGKNDFQVGAGLGLRYYTVVGPLRLDVAVPLNPGEGDPDFAVYFGIGQAF